MSPTRKDDLRKAVEQAQRGWNPPAIAGDPNLVDFHLLAKEAERHLGLSPPWGLPPKKNGVALVTLVGKHLIDRPDPQKWTFLRDLTPAVLSERVLALVAAIQSDNLLSFDEPLTFLAAFYAYHGFFNMAKVIRPDYVDPTSATGKRTYTPQDRERDYGAVEAVWREETKRGNFWVQYGVSVTRFKDLEQDIVDSWVPFGSPYWNE